jgi:hypothetical protein
VGKDIITIRSISVLEIWLTYRHKSEKYKCIFILINMITIQKLTAILNKVETRIVEDMKVGVSCRRGILQFV